MTCWKETTRNCYRNPARQNSKEADGLLWLLQHSPCIGIHGPSTGANPSNSDGTRPPTSVIRRKEKAETPTLQPPVG